MSWHCHPGALRSVITMAQAALRGDAICSPATQAPIWQYFWLLTWEMVSTPRLEGASAHCRSVLNCDFFSCVYKTKFLAKIQPEDNVGGHQQMRNFKFSGDEA